jgi:hypothetical protein
MVRAVREVTIADESETLARRFEENRAHLRTVTYRMVGL